MQFNLALTYFQLNQFEEARKPLEPAMKRWPDLYQINMLYGAVLMKLGDLQPAREALRHAHDLNPQDPGTAEMLYATTLDLARKTQDTHQYPDALRYLQEASSMRPDDPIPHRRMAEIYTLTGRPDDAKAQQEMADKLAAKNGTG
jgi:predicted Zn-dependent protease